MSRRTAAFLAAALCLVAAALVACSSDDTPEAVAAAFAKALPTGNLDAIGFVDPNNEPSIGGAVAKQVTELAGELPAYDLTMSVTGNASTVQGYTVVPMAVDWKLRGKVWHYETKLRLIKQDDRWKIVWAASILHPLLKAGDKLALRSTGAARGSILDNGDEALIKARPVVVVGLQPSQVRDQAAMLSALAKAFAKVKVQVSLADLPAQLAAAKPDAFVEVATLRRDAYDRIRGDIHELPGTVFQEGLLPLAPSRVFARALLGSVDDVRADQIEKNPGRYAAGDLVGQGGLEEQYDAQLAGTKGFRVVIVSVDSTPEKPQESEVFKADPVAGVPLKTTLDQAVQTAADGALASTTNRSALVAIRVSDGALLAVANGPDAATVNLALTANVPPGSTFKVVSALGLLDTGGVTPDAIVACPKTYPVEGRVFKNSNDFSLGAVPFHTDFAKSCNTAFASLAGKLGPTGLNTAARSVGIGTAWKLGTDVYTGSVQTNPSPIESAASAFGQGQTLVSPAAMAAATAAIARGAWIQPTLLRTMPAGAPGAGQDKPAPPANGTALKPASVAAIKAMMREVVTAGTGTALADVPGGDVFAKTGTAEFDNNPAHTHAWVVGWQGDIAFAVFVENGGGSATTAVPIAETFLRAL